MEVPVPITIQELPDESILLVQFQDPLDLGSEASHFADRLRAALDASHAPLIVIANASAVTFSAADMAAGLALIARGEAMLLQHPKVAGYIVAMGNNLPALGAATQPDNERVTVHITRTLDEALHLIRNSLLHRAR
jgi:hypothetical protein